MSTMMVARLIKRLLDKWSEALGVVDPRFVGGSLERQLDLEELIGFTFQSREGRTFVVWVGKRNDTGIDPTPKTRRKKKA